MLVFVALGVELVEVCVCLRSVVVVSPVVPCAVPVLLPVLLPVPELVEVLVRLGVRVSEKLSDTAILSRGFISASYKVQSSLYFSAFA